jgi:Uma2 family endonuclease
LGWTEELILTSPPFLCIEVLSKDDRAADTQERIDDFLAMGVRYVWVVNPRSRRGYVYTAEGSREAKDGVLRTADPEIAVPLPEIFDKLKPGSGAWPRPAK